jgi:hypothetical protein
LFDVVQAESETRAAAARQAMMSFFMIEIQNTDGSADKMAAQD